MSLWFSNWRPWEIQSFKVMEFMERINIRVAIFCKEVGLVYELLNVWFGEVGDEGMRGEKIDHVNKFLSNRGLISND